MRPQEQFLVFTAFVVLVLSVVFGYAHYAAVISAGGGWSSLGVRGDFVGGYIGAGAGVSGMLLFFAALLHQSSELKLQREELALQRKEMAASRTVATDQAAALEAQEAQLKRQNNLAQQRDDAQLILSLAKVAVYAEPGADYNPNVPIITYALKLTAKRFEDTPDEASDLLNLFVVHCGPVHLYGNSTKKILEKAVEEIVTQTEKRIRSEDASVAEKRAQTLREWYAVARGIIADHGRIPHEFLSQFRRPDGDDA